MSKQTMYNCLESDQIDEKNQTNEIAEDAAKAPMKTTEERKTKTKAIKRTTFHSSKSLRFSVLIDDNGKARAEFLEPKS